MTEPKKPNIELVLYRLDEVKTRISSLEAKVDNHFVSKDAYQIEMNQVKDDVRYLKNLVYGAVATFITLAIGAALAGSIL